MPSGFLEASQGTLLRASSHRFNPAVRDTSPQKDHVPKALIDEVPRFDAGKLTTLRRGKIELPPEGNPLLQISFAG